MSLWLLGGFNPQWCEYVRAKLHHLQECLRLWLCVTAQAHRYLILSFLGFPFKIFRTYLLGRGFQTFIKNVSFSSQTDVGSHRMNVVHYLSSIHRHHYVILTIILHLVIRSNLSLSPDESWLPIVSILICIAHIQVSSLVSSLSFELFTRSFAKFWP